MKRSRQLSTSILIVFALLLSAAGELTNTQPIPERLAQSSQPAPTDSQAQTPEAIEPSQQPTISWSRAYNASPRTDDAHRLCDRIAGILTSQQFFNFLLAVGTFLIAFFNYNLLLLDRPVLVVDRPQGRFLSPKDRQKAREEGHVFIVASARCAFRNVGKGPAIVSQIIAKMKLHIDLPLPPNFNDCTEANVAKKEPVIPPGTDSDFFVLFPSPSGCSEQEWKDITDGKMKLVLYGKIFYKGMFPRKRYEATFGFVYEPPDSSFGSGNVFRFGRTEYNVVK
jgi:hypothetical protein